MDAVPGRLALPDRHLEEQGYKENTKLKAL
jgi:hypothetical protein